MGRILFSFVLVGFFIYAETACAEMTSTNYQIRWDSVTTGGSDSSTSASYGLRDSVGNLATGDSSSTNYQTSSGYRAGVFDQILTFNLFSQATSDFRSVSASSGLTLSTGNTASVETGDFVALIQDFGANQITAVGKVSSVSANTSITVDFWSTNGTSPTIDGVSDVYIELNGTSASFGSLDNGNVSTLIIGMEISSELTNGYSVQVLSNGNLTSGSYTISAVSDGSVTAGSSEYGALSSDITLASSTFDTQDTALTTSFQDIVTQSGIKFNDRNFLTLKASKNDQVGSGTYTQTLSFIASGNF